MKSDSIYTRLKNIHEKVSGYISSNLASVSGIREQESTRL